MLGTEKIKATFAGVLTIAAQLAKVLDDGKITLIELPGLAIASTSIPSIVENAKTSLEEFKDLSPKEAKEVKDYIKDNFTIDNKDLEGKIEQAMELLSDTYTLAINGWNLFGSWKAWASTL